MNLSKELLEKAKDAKTSEELLALAKAENVELTAEEAERIFAALHRSGALADEELDNVSGGCGGRASPSGAVDAENKIVYLYPVGKQVEVFSVLSTTKRAHIAKQFPKKRGDYYYPYYTVDYTDGSPSDDVGQDSIQEP